MPRAAFVSLLVLLMSCAHRAGSTGGGGPGVVAPWPPTDDVEREEVRTTFEGAKRELEKGITAENSQRTYDLIVKSCHGGIEEACEVLAARTRRTDLQVRGRFSLPDALPRHAEVQVLVDCQISVDGVATDCTPLLDDPFKMTAAYIEWIKQAKLPVVSFDGVAVASRQRHLFMGPKFGSKALDEARERVQAHPDSGSAWRHLALMTITYDGSAQEGCTAAAKAYALLRRDGFLAELNARCALAEGRLVAAEAFAVDAAREFEALPEERKSRFLTLARVLVENGKCADAKEAVARAGRIGGVPIWRHDDRTFVEQRCGR